MNFIPATAVKTGESTAQVTALGSTFAFESKAPLGELAEGEGNAVLGVRPEFLKLKAGTNKATVYATLPAGMETTVKLETPNGTMLTSVEFGSVDYQLNEPVSYEIAGDGIILFDKKSENNIGKGFVRA